MVWQMQTRLYSSFVPVLNYYEPHTFTMVINPNVIDVSLVQPGGFLSYQTPDMPNPYLFMIESRALTKSPSGKGSDEMTITGRGIKAILDSRRHMEEFSAGTGYDIQTGVSYETAIRHYINQEVISPTDTARTLTGITWHETDYGRGGTVADTQKRTESVLDTCVGLSKTSTLGFDFIWSGSGLNFEIVFYEGVDYSASGSTRVTLSVDLKNLKGGTYNEDITALKNVVYAGGTGDGSARVLQEVYTAPEPSGWDRRETFLDASDCATTDQLTEKGNELLAESGESLSMSFEYNPVSQSYVFGKDFTIGDIVNIKLPWATEVSRIISASWTYDKSGVKMTMTAGKAKPDFIRILKSAILKSGIGGKH